jgi:hypothetical protein
MRRNNMHGAEAGKAFSDMLAQNTVLKELDLSSQQVGTYGDALDAAFAREFAEGISGNGAMTSINLSNNIIVSKTKMVMPKQGMAVGDLIDGNPITCIWSSGTDVDVIIYDGIRAIANAIPDMRALTSLDISKNHLYAEGTKLLAEALKSNPIMTALNISSNAMTYNGKDHGDMSGIAALAGAIHGMGALSFLDLCKSNLGGKGAKALGKQLRIGSFFCEDGKRFKRKGMVAQSTCKHCRNKKSAHGKGALTKLDASENTLTTKQKHALKQAAGSRCVCAYHHVFNCKVLVLTPSALTGSNSYSNLPRASSLCVRAVHDVGVGGGSVGSDSTGGSTASLVVAEAMVVHSTAILSHCSMYDR